MHGKKSGIVRKIFWFGIGTLGFNILLMTGLFPKNHSHEEFIIFYIVIGILGKVGRFKF